jgi:hypothetical protein
MFSSKVLENIRTFMNIPLGAEVFDARLIISQIILFQTSQYFLLSFVLFLLDAITGNYVCVDQYFNYKTFNIRTRFGLVTIIAWLTVAFVGAVCLYLIVQRTRKCLDFCVTFFVIHFFMCVFYRGFPMRWEWWIVQVLNTFVMTVVGEFLCYRREMQYIPVKKSNREVKTPDTPTTPILEEIQIREDEHMESV